jgi:hypothetical protein
MNMTYLMVMVKFGANLSLLTVDGKFGEWGDYGPCSVTCGDGSQTRERKCDNPAPQHGGAQCQGDSKETKACKEKPCPGQLPIIASIHASSFSFLQRNFS